MAAKCILVTDSVSSEKCVSKHKHSEHYQHKGCPDACLQFSVFLAISWFLIFWTCGGAGSSVGSTWTEKGQLFSYPEKLIPPHWLGHHISVMWCVCRLISHPLSESLGPVFKWDANIRQTRYFIPRTQPWAGKMAQLVKHLPSKHKDMSLIPKPPLKAKHGQVY